MKKRVIVLSTLFVCFVALFVIFVSAAETKEQKVNKALACLNARVNGTVGDLTLEQAIFSALASVPNNKVNISINSKKNPSENCWPNSGCTIKETAQVVLAKKAMEQKTEGIEKWLISKNGTTNELTWYLQITIDNNAPASCKIRYDSQETPEYSVNFDEEMKIKDDSSPGPCLTAIDSKYRLQVASNCVNKEFDVMCIDKGFRTNLLYQKDVTGPIYVVANTAKGDANQWTKQTISALCFKQGGVCNYEGSLWAAASLYSTLSDFDNDGKPDYLKFVPYLKALADSNKKDFPSAFLLHIVGKGKDNEYYNDVVQNLKSDPKSWAEGQLGGYWQIPNSLYGKYYDSAIGLVALGGDNGQAETQKVVNYLLAVQDESGCWNSGSIKDSAFLIYAAGWNKGQGATYNSVCGNGFVEYGEDCDGTDLNGKTCGSIGMGTGVLGCYAQGYSSGGQDYSCRFNTAGCFPDLPNCGNGVIDSGEQCDGTNLSGQSCESLNLGSGILNCYSNESQYKCKFNTTSCQNGTVEPPPIIIGTSCADVNGLCKTQCSTNETTTTNGACFGNNVCCLPVGGGGGTNLTSCEAAGNFCVFDWESCLNKYGQILDAYSCTQFNKFCCPGEIQELPNCASQGGIVCAIADQRCSDAVVQASDGSCCLTTCESLGTTGCTIDNECATGEKCQNGQCVSSSTSGCSSDSDCASGEKCESGSCIAQGGSNTWIWIVVFAVLICIVVLGIIFKDKLRMWLFKMKSGKGKPKEGPGWPPPRGAIAPGMRRMPPRFGPPPTAFRPGMARAAPRVNVAQPIAQPTKPQPRKTQMSEKDKEMEETLKKLKEMSK